MVFEFEESFPVFGNFFRTGQQRDVHDEVNDLTSKLAICTNMAVIEKFKTDFPVYIGLVSVNSANTYFFIFNILLIKAEPENWLAGYMFTRKQLTGLYTLD